jgi:putative peptidoglycan lipid II flippase
MAGSDTSYLRNWLTVGAVSALGVAAGVGAQTAMAWRFGTSAQLDAFYVAFLLASYLPIVYQSAVADPLVPAYCRAEGPDRFASAVLALTLVAGVLAGIVLLLLDRVAVAVVSPGFSPVQSAMARGDLRVLSPVPLLFAVALCLTAVLAAQRQFAIARASMMIVPAAQCLGIVFGARFGMAALLWSTVAGYFLYAVTLWVSAGSINPFRARWADLRSPSMRMMIVVGAPMTVTIATGALHAFIDRAMSSRLGPGSVSTLAYAEKLNNVICLVFLVPLTFVALPYLSAAVARPEFVKVYLANVRAALLVFIPAAVFAGGLSVPLVDIALRRGGFGPHDVARVAAAFSAYMVGLPLYAVAGLTGRAFVAAGKTWFLAVAAPAALLLKFGLNLLLMKRYDVAGAALATSIGYIVFSLVTLAALLSAAELRSLARELPHIAAGIVAAVVALFAARIPMAAYATSLSLLQRVLIAGAAAAAFAAVYGGLVGGYYYLRLRDEKSV